MKFILAPDKYKNSISGTEFCEIVANIIKSECPSAEIIDLPLADGGDGMLNAVKHYLDLKTVQVEVKNAVFEKIKAEYVLDEKAKTAYIEMSEASGLRRIQPHQKDLFKTSTFGTGELISHVLDENENISRIVLGLGGSATNDAGIGMAAALGFRFLDAEKKELPPVGENLKFISEIDTAQVHPKLNHTEFILATDVQNVLYGEHGAAQVFGPQKTNSKTQIQELDAGLKHFSEVIQLKYNKDFSDIPGSGAAGGLGFGGLVFLKANLVSGIDLIMDIAQFEHHLKNADWVITGEGQLDSQTASGKTISGILKCCENKTTKVAAFCGGLDLSIQSQKNMGLTYAVSILNSVSSLDQAVSSTKSNLEKSIFNFLQLIK